LIPIRVSILFFVFAGATVAAQTAAPGKTVSGQPVPHVFGFRDFTAQQEIDQEFLAVPDRLLARQHLKTLTAAPHWASSPEDYATAQYVAAQFRAAGMQTQIVPYSVWMTKPLSILVEAFDTNGHKLLTGPTPEHVPPAARGTVDPYQDDPRIIPTFNSSSPSGDVTAPVVYANYGRVEDFRRLSDLGISVKGKIVLVRYGVSFRGVKVYLAQRAGAAGVLIYSDPADDDSRNKVEYPDGPARPDSAVQRGSVQFLPIYPGDPTTPGVASVPSLPASGRIPADKLQYDTPSIPAQPLSWADAQPILRALTGPAAPSDWQGGGPLKYRFGGSDSVVVHLRIAADARLRTIWDVIGRIPGSDHPDEYVVAGNHRDAWVYGATDPGSGTAAMLETAHGLGVLLKHGWRPRRTIILGSWDAEEQGLIGSTEWVEQHPSEMQRTVAYLNLDEAASGPTFNAGAVPSLYRFIREAAAEVPSPAGGTVLDQWRTDSANSGQKRTSASPATDTKIGDLGSGSDYTPFFQHAAVPATDISSSGPFGVYHSVFDDFDWFTRFADPEFAYTQQQARLLGIQILHMADADVLPYDDQTYANEILRYLAHSKNDAARHRIELDYTRAEGAAQAFAAAAHRIFALELSPPANATNLNRALRAAETALLLPEGLPHRSWYRHSIFAPGEFTGYAAVALPGVSDAIQERDVPRAQAQLNVLADALDRAATALDAAR
jgi:N-acetylated-alpha-linked acidic dipeptidase